MRPYAFLLFALCAIAARAATIPDTSQTQKSSENVSSEQELIDLSNTINEVDNKLRAKPEDIPVEVVVENVQPSLKASVEKTDSEEIIRQPIDLKNPGLPQRQEHETQNPESDTTEQQIVQVYKQNLNNAQVVLKQGFQSVNDGFQNLFDNNEKIKSVQQSIQTLREDFIEQINKLNESIQKFKTDKPDPIEQKRNTELQQVEYNLNSLKNDFNKGVNTLTDGIQVFSLLRAESAKEDKPGTGATSVNPQASPQPVNLLFNFWNGVLNRFNNMAQSVNDIVNRPTQGSGAQQSTGNVTAQPQADTPSTTGTPTTQTGPFNNFVNFFTNNPLQNLISQNSQGQGSNPFQSLTNNQQNSNPFQAMIDNFQSTLNGYFNLGGNNSTQSQPVTTKPENQEKPVTSETSEKPVDSVKPDESEKPETSDKPDKTGEKEKPSTYNTQAAAVTPLGPVREFLQNNPISQSIVSTVQRLQNINNPEKPREPQQDNAVAPTNQVADKPKEHRPSQNGNNDSSGVEASEPMMDQEVVPEVQEPVGEVKKQPQLVVEKTE